MEENKEFNFTFRIEPSKIPLWKRMGYKSEDEYHKKCYVGLTTKDGTRYFDHNGNDVTDELIKKSNNL